MDAHCDRCIDLGKWVSNIEFPFTSEPRYYTVPLGSFSDDCTCCKSIISAYKHQNGGTEPVSNLTFSVGQTFRNQTEPSDQCMLMSWTETEFQFTFHLSLYPLADRASGLSISDQHINLDLARQWLHQCEATHGSRCWTRSDIQEIKIDLLLVDVQERCLVKRASAGIKYVALSYVWGSSQVTKTTMKNLAEFMEKGSLSKPEIVLPKSIDDAIFITRELGIRYIWIDSLCIVQDDPQIQIYLDAMASIYSNAFVTLALTKGKHADQGIEGLGRPHSIPRKTPIHHVRFRENTMSIDPRSSFKVSLTPWRTRGWTFQEGHFSGRMLIFDNLMLWTCPTCYREEGGVNQWPWCDSKGEARPETIMTLCKSGKVETMKSYCDMVIAFLSREFSFDSDVLSAFAGVLKLANPTKTTNIPRFFYGHPLSCFEQTLLWSAYSGLPRRDTRIFDTRNDGTPGACHRVPTWSCFSQQGAMGLTGWLRSEENPEGRERLLKRPCLVLKQCVICLKWVEIRDSCAHPSVGGASLPFGEQFSSTLSIRTQRARFVVRLRGAGDPRRRRPDAIVYSMGSTEVGNVKFDDEPEIPTLNHQENATPLQQAEAVYNFIAIFVDFRYMGEKKVEYVNALCVERKTDGAADIFEKVGTAEIEKRVWDEVYEEAETALA